MLLESTSTMLVRLMKHLLALFFAISVLSANPAAASSSLGNPANLHLKLEVEDHHGGQLTGQLEAWFSQRARVSAFGMQFDGTRRWGPIAVHVNGGLLDQVVSVPSLDLRSKVSLELARPPQGGFSGIALNNRVSLDEFELAKGAVHLEITKEGASGFLGSAPTCRLIVPPSIGTLRVNREDGAHSVAAKIWSVSSPSHVQHVVMQGKPSHVSVTPGVRYGLYGWTDSPYFAVEAESGTGASFESGKGAAHRTGTLTLTTTPIGIVRVIPSSSPVPSYACLWQKEGYAPLDTSGPANPLANALARCVMCEGRVPWAEQGGYFESSPLRPGEYVLEVWTRSDLAVGVPTVVADVSVTGGGIAVISLP